MHNDKKETDCNILAQDGELIVVLLTADSAWAMMFAKAIATARALTGPAAASLTGLTLHVHAKDCSTPCGWTTISCPSIRGRAATSMWQAKPVHWVLDDTLEKYMKKFAIPKSVGSYMDSKGMTQVAFVAQIRNPERVHELVTDKVHWELPLEEEELEAAKLKIEAMWAACCKWFQAQGETEAKSELANQQRPIGKSERETKIKAFEIRNNSQLDMKQRPSKTLWETVATAKDRNEFVYIPIEKAVGEWDQESMAKFRTRDVEGVDREHIEQTK